LAHRFAKIGFTAPSKLTLGSLARTAPTEAAAANTSKNRIIVTGGLSRS